MIRGVRHYSLAVRRPDGAIFCSTEPVSSRFSGRVRRMPFLRGILILAETLWLGMKSLQRSAVIAAAEPAAADADADGPAAGNGSDGAAAVSNWTMGITMAIALALGWAYFWCCRCWPCA